MPLVEKWKQCIAKLLSFLALEDDWNSAGAAAPAPMNVYSAVTWLHEIQQRSDLGWIIQPPQAVPGVNGEVLLVWQDPSCYLEVEINDPARLEWMLTSPGQPPQHWTTPARVSLIGGSVGQAAASAETLPSQGPTECRVANGAALAASLGAA
jgi:hypothetical protein